MDVFPDTAFTGSPGKAFSFADWQYWLAGGESWQLSPLSAHSVSYTQIDFQV